MKCTEVLPVGLRLNFDAIADNIVRFGTNEPVNLLRLLADLTFQLHHPPPLRPVRLSVTWKRLVARLPELTRQRSSTLALTSTSRATSASDTPASSRRTAGQLELPGELLA